MSRKSTHVKPVAEKAEEYPIDPKTGRPKATPKDHKGKKQKRSQSETAESPEPKRDVATWLTSLPGLGTLFSLLFSFPPHAQRALWLVSSGAVAWAMVQLLVVTMPGVIGYTEENILTMFTASVFIVAVAPIIATRNWRHLLRPVAVTALCWAVYPEAMPIVLFIGLVRIFVGEVATTSLWPSTTNPPEDSHAKKRG